MTFLRKFDTSRSNSSLLASARAKSSFVLIFPGTCNYNLCVIIVPPFTFCLISIYQRTNLSFRPLLLGRLRFESILAQFADTHFRPHTVRVLFLACGDNHSSDLGLMASKSYCVGRRLRLRVAALTFPLQVAPTALLSWQIPQTWRRPLRCASCRCQPCPRTFVLDFRNPGLSFEGCRL